MIADIIVVLVMLLCIFLGYKRGLIKVAVKILSFVAALIVAFVLYTPISNYIIENTELVPNLEKTIEEKIYKGDNNEKDTVENKNYLETVENYIENYTEEIKENTANSISNQIAVAVVRIGTWIALFIITKIAMLFIKLFTDAIAQIPIIKQFNKARRNNLWNIRRVCNNIWYTCNNKCYISNYREK